MDADDWDERYAATELVWSRGPNEFIAAECADLPPGRAVDLACGEGRNAIWLASRAWSLTAIDFSQVALDKGATLAPEITWLRADATTWHGSDYDLALIAYLQLPADQRRAANRNAVQSLRSGGTFLLIAHDATNLSEGTGGPQDLAVLMSAEDVVADLDGLAVDVIRAERVPRTVRVDDGHGSDVTQTAWDCLVRVTRR